MSEQENKGSFRGIVLELLRLNNPQFGQAFERFYRPQLGSRDARRLEQIATEELNIVRAGDVAGMRSRVFVRGLRKSAKALARKIYELAAEKWEENVNVYLKIIDEASAGLTSEETKVLLAETRESFKSQFGGDRLERGESTEILDQIVKRAGDETRERLKLVLDGVDVPSLAREIWEIYFSGATDAKERIAAILLDLTDQQIREVRIEFSSLSAKIVAEELYRCLQPWNTPEEVDPRAKVIQFESSSEFVDLEDEQEEEFIPQFDFEGFCYAMLGRSSEEIRQIELFYNDLFATDSEGLPLMERVKQAFTDTEQRLLENVFGGFSPQRTSEALESALQVYGRPPPGISPVEKGLTGEYPVADELVGKLWKRRLYRDGLSDRDLMVEASLEIAEILRLVSLEKMSAANEALHERTGHILDLRFVRGVREPVPARIGQEMIIAARKGCGLMEVLTIMEGLSPGEMAAVRHAFSGLYGKELETFLETLVPEHESAPVRRLYGATIRCRIAGNARAKLGLDLLSLWNEEELPDDLDFFRSEEEIEQFEKFTDEMVRAADWSIASFRKAVENLDPELRFFAAHDYWRKSNRSFLSYVRGRASDEALQFTALLDGIDLDEIVEQLSADPVQLGEFAALSDHEIEGIIRLYDASRGQNALLQDLLAVPEDKRVWKEAALASYFRPLAGTLHDGILHIRRHRNSEEIDLLSWFKLSYPCARALEQAYCWRFGSLRGRLKSLLSENLISRQTLAEVCLRLEGIDEQMLLLVDELVEAGDLVGLQEVFRKLSEDVKTLEEAFDVAKGSTSLHQVLLDIEAPRAAIDRTILFLEGYYPDTVAGLVHKALQFKEIAQREAKLELIFSDPFSEEHPNSYLPSDLNWITEMYIQIRLAYQEQFGRPILKDLFSSEISVDILGRLRTQLFGAETVGVVGELKRAIGLAGADGLVDTLISELKDKPARYVQGIVELFDSEKEPGTLRSLVESTSSERRAIALKILSKEPEKKPKQ